ncbi:unnamed protein product [Parnassius mnemosyne]|uniref:Reverse transcriptase domain-containing protein n=1 Tax=Parnassius mnemosyne TaxID=213953 RepID=A0AAV1K5C0_9NEOP
MTVAINKLLELGAIIECSPSKGQFISKIFLAPKPNGGKRFILNLKSLNKFISKPHFKMEDYRTASKLIPQDGYLATIDLKEAYLLVPIHPRHRKYLRFQFETLENKLVTYEFTAMPYGLSVAPRVFTKIMREVISCLRSRGHDSVIYLDDTLCIGSNYHMCSTNVNDTLKLMKCLGFIINVDKSYLQPNQTCKFLGFIFNTTNLTISLPEEKRTSIIQLVQKFLRISHCTIREFAQLIGVLIAACPAVKYGWLYTKMLERQKFLALLKNNNYEKEIEIPKTISPDLNWWSSSALTTSNHMRNAGFKIKIYTDASQTGWGAVCSENRAHGWWSVSEREFHINYLELLAIFLGLKSSSCNESNCSILLRVDNTTALSYVNRMGGIQFPHLNDITRRIWRWCEERNIVIYASYVNTKDNRADAESRIVNPDTECELSDCAFHSIMSHFGQPEVDLFASRTNAKCPSFVSWKPDPEAMAVDAFTINWNNCYFYAFPPFSIILKCLRKIVDDKADGIFVFPFWPSQPWFPLLQRLMVSDILYLNPHKFLLQSNFREHHPLHAHLTLGVARLSNKPSLNAPEALVLMLASLSESTVKQYNVSYKLWWQFCNQHIINVFSPSLTFIMLFVTEQFNTGCSYGSLNSHRSALSLLVGSNLTTNDSVKRLLKGAYKLKPSVPKYIQTWDPQIVLNYLKEWFPNINLSLEKITKKLVTLLAICTGHRVQTLSLIKLENISFTSSGAKIVISDLIKTSAPGRDQPVLVLPFFTHNLNICPASTLKDYISFTDKKRLQNNGNLLLTFKHPHKPATTQTISRWIKQVLSESGIDVSVFGAHSTRHASTSAAFSAGASVELYVRLLGGHPRLALLPVVITAY